MEGSEVTTNLDMVKQVACMLLEVPIQQIPGLPFVNHPIFTSSLYPIGEGMDKLVDITVDTEGLETVKEFVCQRINECESITKIGAIIIDKKYRMAFLHMCSAHTSPADIGTYLNHLWRSVENIMNDPNVSSHDIIKLFEWADPNTLMNEAERKALEALPDTITVYRGIRKPLLNNHKRFINGFSWSTSFDVAYWFAKRFAHNQEEMGKVFKAEIQKKHILAFFGVDSYEREVVINPSKLQNITEIPVVYDRNKGIPSE